MGARYGTRPSTWFDVADEDLRCEIDEAAYHVGQGVRGLQEATEMVTPRKTTGPQKVAKPKHTPAQINRVIGLVPMEDQLESGGSADAEALYDRMLADLDGRDPHA